MSHEITSFKQYGDSPGQVDQDAIMIDYDDVESEEDDTDEDNGLDNEYHDTLPEKATTSWMRKNLCIPKNSRSRLTNRTIAATRIWKKRMSFLKIMTVLTMTMDPWMRH